MARTYRFTWDPEKARRNQRKHGVSFEEATSVFEDPELAYFSDLGDPGRFTAIGYSALARMLVVVHLEAGGTIRIISARKASRHERMVYAKEKG
jgi:uncharacterized DUF497 family protein